MKNEDARRFLADLEAELRRLGWWQTVSPPSEAFEDMGPFGAKTMAFSQWLQFVLCPRIEEILSGTGQWPNASQVGARAIREYDGLPEASGLVRLLCEWDAMVGAIHD